jgi:arylesterase/paraoxonase
MGRVFTLLGLIALAVGAYFIWMMTLASGVFAGLKPRLIDQCRRVEIFPGTEDVTIDPELGVAFISADDRRATFSGNPVQGGVYVLKLDGTDRVLKASPDSFGAFHPHGLSLWRAPDGRKRLFAVNHTPNDGDKVEIFEVGLGGALLHVDSVAFPAMESPNDVLAVGPRSFYATNDRGFKEGLMSTLEAYLALPFSSLVYFDGQKGSVALRGLTYANGVNMSADGSKVYVSEFLRRRIGVYDRDAETGKLTKVKSIPVNTGPDNIEVAGDGALWVAGHTKVFDFLQHAEDPSAVAPSHVIRVDPRSGDAKDVLIDTAGTINASSVGAVFDDTLIVGAVFDGHVMVCPTQ